MERQKYFSELVPTQRKYTDHDTKRVFTLYTHPSTHNYELIYDNPKNDLDLAKGTSVNGFYLCPFDSVSIKLNTGKVINLSCGEFYALKENEVNLKLTNRVNLSNLDLNFVNNED